MELKNLNKVETILGRIIDEANEKATEAELDRMIISMTFDISDRARHTARFMTEQTVAKDGDDVDRGRLAKLFIMAFWLYERDKAMEAAEAAEAQQGEAT